MAGSLRHLPGARRPAGRLVRGQTLAYSPGPGLGVAHWGRRLDCPFPHGRVVAVRVPACSPLPLRGATGRRLPGPGARLDRLDADATARLRPGTGVDVQPPRWGRGSPLVSVAVPRLR